MIYNTHDLLRIDPAGLHEAGQLPDWAREAMRRAPWVVVRRESPSHPGLLPVGIRGPLRAQRLAMQLKESAILERCTPCSLTDTICDALRMSPMPPLAALPSLSTVLSNWRWGLGGSVAFQVATGIPCITAASDLDLLLYPASTISRSDASQLLQRIRTCFDKTDALIETADGAYALAEYASSVKTLLCRTLNGPIVQNHPGDARSEGGNSPR